MTDEQTALSSDDYQALHAMQMSDDAGQRAQADSLAKKLTPSEQQAFFDYQQTANKGKGERTREDNSLFGMPPEVAVLSGMSLGRAIGAEGLTAAGRLVSGMKNAAGQAAPVLKYEVVKHGLQGIGFSPTLATAAAMAIAGYKGKGGAAAEAEQVSAPGFPRTSVAADPPPVAAAPVDLSRVPAGSLTQEQIGERLAATNAGAVPEAATVAAPAPAGARLADQRAAFQARVAARQAPEAQTAAAAPIVSPAAASPAATALPNQKALNELAIAARRAKTTLSPDEARALVKVVEAGQTPQSAVADLMQARLAADPAAAFNARYGLKVPTDAETKFQKGMRGKPTGAAGATQP